MAAVDPNPPPWPTQLDIFVAQSNLRRVANEYKKTKKKQKKTKSQKEWLELEERLMELEKEARFWKRVLEKMVWELIQRSLDWAFPPKKEDKEDDDDEEEENGWLTSQFSEASPISLFEFNNAMDNPTGIPQEEDQIVSITYPGELEPSILNVLGGHFIDDEIEEQYSE